MGCAGSRPSDGESSTRSARGVKLTKTGFHSDVMDQKESHVTHLVHTSSIKKLHEKYDTDKGMELGRGACGTVYAVRHRQTGDLFAMKTVSVDDMGSWEELQNEINVQKKLDHPNICKVIESFEDHNRGVVYIIMEMCTGGSLVSRMKTHRAGYDERMAATMVEKMLSAVMYCHRHGVVHRDIKLDNMIYEDEREEAELKLIDFGFAAKVKAGQEGMWEQLGTPSYMAPELWDESEPEYDSSVDMWAIGVVAYMLLSGQRPFHHQDRRKKARMIQRDPLHFPSSHWAHISDDAKEFCQALMMKQPAERLPASEAVKHNWIKQSKVHAGLDAAHELDKHQEVIDSLVAFSEADDLKKLALEVIAFNTPPSKLEELRMLFQKMDTDDSGTLDLQEFKKGMSLHPEIPQDRLEQIFNKMDVAHNGAIDYTEFLAASISSQASLVEKPSVKAAFANLDSDGDGYVTKDDLMHSLEGVTEDEVSCYMTHADEQGRINLRAFQRTMLNQLNSDEEKSQAAERHIAQLSNSMSKKQLELSEEP